MKKQINTQIKTQIKKSNNKDDNFEEYLMEKLFFLEKEAREKGLTYESIKKLEEQKMFVKHFLQKRKNKYPLEKKEYIQEEKMNKNINVNINDINLIENIDIKKKEIEKPKYWYRLGPPGEKRGYIVFTKTHSNIFMVFTDCLGSVITCKTAAQLIGKNERRKKRKSPLNIETFISSLDDYFTLYNIWGIRLVFYMRPGQYLLNIVKSLIARNILVLRIINSRKIPFSFTRGKRRRNW